MAFGAHRSRGLPVERPPLAAQLSGRAHLLNPAGWLLLSLAVLALSVLLLGDAGRGGLRWLIPSKPQPLDVRPVDPALPESKSAESESSLVQVPPDTDILPNIYSDTAMAPGIYADRHACRAEIKSIIQSMEATDPIIYKENDGGVHYVGFSGKSDSYILRCFKTDEVSYRLFIAGAGMDRLQLSNDLNRIFSKVSGEGFRGSPPSPEAGR